MSIESEELICIRKTVHIVQCLKPAHSCMTLQYWNKLANKLADNNILKNIWALIYCKFTSVKS